VSKLKCTFDSKDRLIECEALGGMAAIPVGSSRILKGGHRMYFSRIHRFFEIER
jgi:hypothetical protein